MPSTHPLDRSTMFSSLLTLSPEFNQLDTAAGGRVVTAALKAWSESRSTDMHAFCKQWLTTVSLTTL